MSIGQYRVRNGDHTLIHGSYRRGPTFLISITVRVGESCYCPFAPVLKLWIKIIKKIYNNNSGKQLGVVGTRDLSSIRWNSLWYVQSVLKQIHNRLKNLPQNAQHTWSSALEVSGKRCQCISLCKGQFYIDSCEGQSLHIWAPLRKICLVRKCWCIIQ